MEGHREEYYERLLAVSRDNDWTGWCGFFLRAIIGQAEELQMRVQAIIDLYGLKKDWILDVTHSHHAVRTLDWIFSRPIFSITDLAASAGVPKATAKRIVALARDGGLLRELRSGHGRRAAILAFPELLNIVEGHQVF
jgi:Fic family protein